MLRPLIPSLCALALVFVFAFLKPPPARALLSVPPPPGWESTGVAIACGVGHIVPVDAANLSHLLNQDEFWHRWMDPSDRDLQPLTTIRSVTVQPFPWYGRKVVIDVPHARSTALPRIYAGVVAWNREQHHRETTMKLDLLRKRVRTMEVEYHATDAIRGNELAIKQNLIEQLRERIVTLEADLDRVPPNPLRLEVVALTCSVRRSNYPVIP